MTRPTIVTLCGSTRFMQEFHNANSRETLAGKIVLTVGMPSHGDCQPTEEQKRRLDELHFRKIEMADEILVLDCPLPYCVTCGKHRVEMDECMRSHAFDGTLRPYIGSSTRNEIAHATALGKRVRYLSKETADALPSL